MLQMQTFQSFNWGYTPFMEPLPIRRVTLLYGSNGSGKTTYLTGIGLLLGISRLPRGQTFERYVREGASWAFLKATVANLPAEDGVRPFDRIVPNPLGQCQSTLACMLVYKSGTWERTHYIVPGEDFQPEPEKKVDRTYVFSPDKYRQALEQVGVRQALLRLLELGITGIRDMQDPRSLFDFFVKLIGREEIRANYNRARSAWREAQDAAEHLQVRYEREAREVEAIEQHIQLQRQRRAFEQEILLCQRLVEHAHLRELRMTLGHRREEVRRLSEDKQRTENELDALARRREGFRGEQEEFDRQYAAWQARRDQALARFTDKRAELAVEEKLVQQLAEEVANLRRLEARPLSEIEALLGEAQVLVSEQYQLCRRLEQRREQLLKEARELERGYIALPEIVSSYLEVLRQHAIPFQLIADYVQVTDRSWLRAVEGVLGGERFTVVVAEARSRLQAKRLAQERRYPYWVSPPKKSAVSSPPQQSLWRAVQVLDESVAGWVADRLLRVWRVQSVEDGDTLSQHDGVVTITPEAYWQEPRGGRSVWPSILVCGSAAREVHMQEVAAELEQLTDPLERENKRLLDMKEHLAALQEQRELALRQQELPTKEQALTGKRATTARIAAEKETLWAEYEGLKEQEQEWTRRSNELVLQRQSIEQKQQEVQERLQGVLEQLRPLDVEGLRRTIEQMEVTLPRLSPELQAIFDEENRSESDYRQRIAAGEQELEQLPTPPVEYDEELFQQQVQRLQSLHDEVAVARSNVLEHRELFTRATHDYGVHIDQLFTRGMAREFHKLCQLVNARGDINVLRGEGDLNDWGLDVRIGFDGKSKQPLSSAPLSRGQEVLTGLYLVLSALRAVHATPILLLDELMSLLDEENVPRVLAGLRETGVQCFVATPQSRSGADEHADVLWGFSSKGTDQEYAAPLAVMVRREDERQRKYE